MPVKVTSGLEFAQQFRTPGNKDLELPINLRLHDLWIPPSWTGRVRIKGKDIVIKTAKPLFESVGEGSSFEGLTVEINYECSERYAGAFVKRQTAGVTFNKCVVRGSVINSFDPGDLSQATGGLCGIVSVTPEGKPAALFKDCVNYAYIAASNRVGGIAGSANNCAFENCVNEAFINDAAATLDKDGVGGIVGRAVKCFMSGCLNKNIITGKSDVGGIAGRTINSALLSCASFSIVTSPLNTAAYNLGGIAGRAEGTLIADCLNAGKLTCGDDRAAINVGGIIGAGSGVDLFSNKNMSRVTSLFEAVVNKGTKPFGTGGIAGLIDDGGNPSTIIDNTQEGDVSSGENVGGIVGCVRALKPSGPIVIERNYFGDETSLTALRAAGGVLGAAWHTPDECGGEIVVRDNCVAADSITADTAAYRVTGGFFSGQPDARGAQIAAPDETLLTLADNTISRTTRLTGANTDPSCGSFTFTGEGVSLSLPPYWYGADNKNGVNAPDSPPDGMRPAKALRYERSADCRLGQARRDAAELIPMRPEYIDPRQMHLGYSHMTDDGSIGTVYMVKGFETVTNIAYNITVNFMSAVSLSPATGIAFQLAGAGIDADELIETGANGELTLCAMKPGEYTLTRIGSGNSWKVHSGYTLNVGMYGDVKVDDAIYGGIVPVGVDASLLPVYQLLPANVKERLRDHA